MRDNESLLLDTVEVSSRTTRGTRKIEMHTTYAYIAPEIVAIIRNTAVRIVAPVLVSST